MINQEEKHQGVSTTTVTRNITDFEDKTGNIYESLVIVSKRANQISAQVKEELNDQLQEFNIPTDTLEEVFENREQIEISKHYERMPKPTLIAAKEFLDGKIYHRNPAKETNEEK
jgi:DNA-directed RNA polymerase subunit K/omega